MKKLTIILFTLLFLFSCSENSPSTLKERELGGEVKQEIPTGKTEEKKEIIPDEIFINSEENKKNKAEALECMEKYKKYLEIPETYKDMSGEIQKSTPQFYDYKQAFKDKNGKCYFLDFHQISLETVENEELKTISSSLYEGEIFDGCEIKNNISVASIDEMDKIFTEKNIFPPRIIYEQKDFEEAKNFIYLKELKEYEDGENGNNLRNLDETLNFLNYYFKYKNSPDYEKIKNIFQKRQEENIKIFQNSKYKCTFDFAGFGGLKYQQLNSNDLEKLKKELEIF